jgi:hypothetical protein
MEHVENKILIKKKHLAPSLLYNEYQVIAMGKAAGAWR